MSFPEDVEARVYEIDKFHPVFKPLLMSLSQGKISIGKALQVIRIYLIEGRVDEFIAPDYEE